MKDLSIAKRYARAVLLCALEEKKIEKILEELLSLKKAVKDSSELKNVLSLPMFKMEERNNIIKKILSIKEFTKTLSEFLIILSEKNRFDYLENIADEFEKMYLDLKNIKRAVVESALELGSKEKDEIKKILSKKFNSDFEISYEVNPELIAGFRVIIGNTIFDDTLKHHIVKMEERVGLC